MVEPNAKMVFINGMPLGSIDQDMFQLRVSFKAFLAKFANLRSRPAFQGIL